MNIGSDIKFSLRLVRKDPWTALLVVFLLSLGVCLSTVMFTFLKGTIWSYPSMLECDDLVHVAYKNEYAGRNGQIPIVGDLFYFQENSKTMEHIAGFQFSDHVFYDAASNNSATAHPSSIVSYNFFDALGVHPILGRTFSQSDEGNLENFVVIAHGLWVHHFEQSPDVIGHQVQLDGNVYTVIGVMPEGFKFPFRHELWIPGKWNSQLNRNREDQSLTHVLAVPNEGFSRRECLGEFNTMAAILADEFPETNKELRSVQIQSYGDFLLADMDPNLMYIALICALGVLLVSCANVSNLILAKSFQRSHELALRNALGAKRHRIISQMVSYGLILALAGSIVGLFMAAWTLRLILTNAEVNWNGLPNWWSFDIDYRVFLFVTILVFASGIATSIIPAIRASKIDMMEMIKDSTRTSSSKFMGIISKILVTAQIASSAVMMLLAFGVSMCTKLSVLREPVFDIDSMVSTTFRVQQFAGFETTESVHAFYQDLNDRLMTEPSIESVAFVNAIRGGIQSHRKGFKIEGEDYADRQNLPTAQFADASVSFFETMGISEVAGRLFSEFDTDQSLSVVIVNQSFVKTYFQGQNVIGKRLQLEGRGEMSTIIGVVPDIQLPLLPGQHPWSNAAIYVPHKQGHSRTMSVVIKSVKDPSLVIKALYRHIGEVGPNVAFYYYPATGRDLIEDNMTASMKILSLLFSMFGFISLSLATIGLYAVVDFNTKSRAKELGIRLALGANKWKIVQTVLSRNIVQMVVGIVLGVSVGHFLTNLVKGTLNCGSINLPFGTYLGVVFILVFASLIASLIPAISSIRTEPVDSFRVD